MNMGSNVHFFVTQHNYLSHLEEVVRVAGVSPGLSHQNPGFDSRLWLGLGYKSTLV